MPALQLAWATLLSCGQGGPAPHDGPAVASSTSVPAGAPITPPTCDAGTDAFVQRVFPLIVGRRPHGAAEVAMWAAVADDLGRDTVVRALTRDPQYLDWWSTLLRDQLEASRTGADEDWKCFQDPLLPVHDGSLAEFVRDVAPDGDGFGQPFGMADLLQDALVIDDLSVAWQANLFVRANHVPACAAVEDPVQIETERRALLGDGLLMSYIARDVVCMECHNSEWSTTDNVDPALDRTWGVDALFERALFASSSGPPDPDELYAMFRFDGVVDDATAEGESDAFGPWGIDETCAALERFPPEQDLLGQTTAFFGQEYGSTGSLWDIERLFRSGADALSAAPLAVAPDRTLPGDQAFAYLTGQHVVDHIWALAFGSGLTLPYGFSRNEAQQQRLAALTDAFVASGWSLRELLVGITADPYFNTGLPSTCGAASYGLDPVVDPYTTDDPDPALRGNGPGDLVHRFEARALLRSASDALELPRVPEFFTYAQTGLAASLPAVDLQRSLGVYLSSSEPGFGGVDFQGMLSWEASFGTCTQPYAPGSFVSRAYGAALAADATVEDLALAIRDRLVSDGAWADDTERGLVEALVGLPLDTRLSEVPADVDLVRGMGLFCGTLTLSPEFFTTVEPRPIGPLPSLDLSSAADCTSLESLLEPEGVACSGPREALRP